MAAHVLVVEYQSSLRREILGHLERVGFHVTTAEEDDESFSHLDADPADLVVVDGRPGGDIGAVLRRIRAAGEAGIVVLLDGRADERIEVLQAGADAYLTKPLNLRELEAQLRTLYRRIGRSKSGLSETMPPIADPPPAAVLRPAFSPQGPSWTFDSLGWQLITPEQKRVRLTGGEQRCLATLGASPGNPVSREDILAAMGGEGMRPGDRRIDMLIGRLRRKVQDAGGSALPIQTVHGIGYVFNAPLLVR